MGMEKWQGEGHKDKAGNMTRVRDKSMGQRHTTRTVSTGQVLGGRTVGKGQENGTGVKSILV